ncbi:hypothetical protein BIZ35_16645 [Heyndrickxia coagulans]|nr:hypothetical protein BIZ35_16645 [Heyndrickxia coagulans]
MQVCLFRSRRSTRAYRLLHFSVRTLFMGNFKFIDGPFEEKYFMGDGGPAGIGKNGVDIRKDFK